MSAFDHDDDPHREIRDAVAASAPISRRLLAQARPRAGYPTAFVQALTEAGFLGALIPEEYGGSGLPLCGGGGDPGGDPRQPAATPPPATPRCTSWARCCGTAARSRSAATCRRSPSGELRLQAFGVTEPTTGSDTTAICSTSPCATATHYVVNGQKVWTSRAEHSDLMLLLARTTPRDQVRRSAPTGCRCSSSTCARR